MGWEEHSGRCKFHPWVLRNNTNIKIGLSGLLLNVDTHFFLVNFTKHHWVQVDARIVMFALYKWKGVNMKQEKIMTTVIWIDSLGQTEWLSLK